MFLFLFLLPIAFLSVSLSIKSHFPTLCPSIESFYTRPSLASGSGASCLSLLSTGMAGTHHVTELSWLLC